MTYDRMTIKELLDAKDTLRGLISERTKGAQASILDPQEGAYYGLPGGDLLYQSDYGEDKLVNLQGRYKEPKVVASRSGEYGYKGYPKYMAYFPQENMFEEFVCLKAFNKRILQLSQGLDYDYTIVNNKLTHKGGYPGEPDMASLKFRLSNNTMPLDAQLWVANKRVGRGVSCWAVQYLGRQAKNQDDIDVIRGMLALGV